MVQYAVNRYGEVFPQGPRARRSARRSNRRNPARRSRWERHWAWYDRLNNAGRAGVALFVWPVVLAAIAAFALAAIVVAVMMGVVYAIAAFAEFNGQDE